MQNQPIHGLSGAPERASQKPAQGGEGAAFRALLARLESQSQGLAQSSESLQDSSQLADAVGQSQAALEQAQTISEHLLEAIRAQQLRQAQ